MLAELNLWSTLTHGSVAVWQEISFDFAWKPQLVLHLLPSPGSWRAADIQPHQGRAGCNWSLRPELKPWRLEATCSLGKSSCCRNAASHITLVYPHTVSDHHNGSRWFSPWDNPLGCSAPTLVSERVTVETGFTNASGGSSRSYSQLALCDSRHFTTAINMPVFKLNFIYIQHITLYSMYVELFY